MTSIRRYVQPVLLLVFFALLFVSFTIHAWQYQSNKTQFKNTIKKKLGISAPVKQAREGLYAYRFNYDSILAISPISDTCLAQTISDTTLLLAPGIYKVFGRNFDMRTEGLYRIMLPDKQNRQVIVSRGNLFLLLSAASWVITHGTRDNKLSVDTWNNIACEGKVVVTCSRASLFTHQLLKRFDIQSRKVYCHSDERSPNLFNAHVMLEVFHPTEKYWFLVDVDNNRYFTKQGKALSMMEFNDCLQNNIPYEWTALSKDDGLDTQGVNGLINENLLSESMLHDWYKYVTQQVTIENYSTLYTKL